MSLRELFPWRRGERSVIVRRAAPPAGTASTAASGGAERARTRASELPARHDPFASHDPFEKWFADFERAFGGLAPAATCWSSAMHAFPRVDVVDLGDALCVSAEVPGVERAHLDVTLADGALVLRGVKRERRANGQDGWYRAERCYGSFERSVPLPCEVDPERVDARLEHGVLTVTLEKSERAKRRSRRIEVESP